MSLDLKALRAFDAVAQHRSFLRASVALGIAQSALSRHIKLLEHELGGALLDRTGRGVALTALGERFSPRARALLDAAADLADEARAQGAELSGEVSLGIVPVASRGIVVPLVAAVREKHPRVRLRVLRLHLTCLVDEREHYTALGWTGPVYLRESYAMQRRLMTQIRELEASL